MSRDMLSYEPGAEERYGLSLGRARLIALRHVQDASLRAASGAIFLTQYAADVVQTSCGQLANVKLIPHGVGDEFRAAASRRAWPPQGDDIRIVYVSNAAPYKHQWVVIEAVAMLRERGHRLQLSLIGDSSGPAAALIARAIDRFDPSGRFVQQSGATPHSVLPSLVSAYDIFLFASSCENMPNTLVEGMALGMPIACSMRGPMPEILKDGGVYFAPENPASIADALERLIVDPQRRSELAGRARELASAYSWSRCAAETWAFVRNVGLSSGPLA